MANWAFCSTACFFTSLRLTSSMALLRYGVPYNRSYIKGISSNRFWAEEIEGHQLSVVMVSMGFLFSYGNGLERWSGFATPPNQAPFLASDHWASSHHQSPLGWLFHPNEWATVGHRNTTSCHGWPHAWRGHGWPENHNANVRLLGVGFCWSRGDRWLLFQITIGTDEPPAQGTWIIWTPAEEWMRGTRPWIKHGYGHQFKRR